MYIDTHTHLYVQRFAADRDAVVQRALDAGVNKMYLPNIDRSSIDAMLALESDWPEVCHAMMGLHPCSVKADFEQELAEVESWLQRRHFVAVGEIGIDLYWDKTYVEEQKEAFLVQANWAAERGIPFVIHSREATDLIIELLQKNFRDGMRGIFHCFTGSVAQARAIIDLGFYLGIGGVLTFKNGGLDKVLPAVSAEHLVLETDSPYLAPVPYRGKRNESSYIPHIARKLAEVKDMPLDEVARITTANAKKIFIRTNQNV